MLGIQNSIPTANSVNFGSNPTYSIDDVNFERDAKLKDVNDIKDEFTSLADTLEGNGDGLSKKASKFARGAAAVAGIVTTFIMAKYGSKATINTFKELAKSKPIQSALGAVTKLAEPAGKIVKGAGEIIEKTGLKNSKLAQTATEFIQKDGVQTALKAAKKVVTSTIDSAKKVNYQGILENTIGASAAASVVVDDLAGRNVDKSNFAMAMGASGGDA